MNVKELRESGRILFECRAGSHLYGTNVSTSDEDIRGIFRNQTIEYASLIEPSNEIQDPMGDIKYYALKKFIKLASDCNPAVLEMLWVPDSQILYKNELYDELVKHNSLFVSKEAYFRYSGYAYAQIKKAKGKNKKVHSVDKYVNENGIKKLKDLFEKGKISRQWIEQRFCKHFFNFIVKDKVNDKSLNDSKTDWKEMDKYIDEDIKFLMPKKHEDFCFAVTEIGQYKELISLANKTNYKGFTSMPFRPVTLSMPEIYDCSAISHLPNMYRLYRNGKGIFKGNQIKVVSIPKEREWKDIHGMCYYNESEYEKSHKEWLSFWEWMANRNDKRWTDQENKSIDFDSKNMLHTCRLLLEAEFILKEGRPLVDFRRDHKKLKFLKDIRNNEFDYDFLLGWANTKCDSLKEEYEKCDSLPNKTNMKKINELFVNIMNML